MNIDPTQGFNRLGYKQEPTLSLNGVRNCLPH